MRNRLNGFGRILLTGALLTASAAMAPAQNTPKPDNSKTNKHEAAQPTADQQKNNKSDREITREIRKSIMDDKTLSSNAHNVKVITQHGMVTLKGPVRSDEEKKTVEEKATSVAGAANVKNEITVMSADSSKTKTTK
jgi:hyperosmotically inducible periplasmic protein